MTDNSTCYIESLKELCTKLIDMLEQLKDKGLISEEEYQKHTELKKNFLSDIKENSN